MQIRRPTLIAAFCVAVLLLAGPARADGPPAAGLADAIRTLVAAPPGDATDAPAPDPLRRFYEARNFAPAWVDHPARLAALTTILSGAADQGFAMPLPKAAAGEAISAARDLALTRLALGYAAALSSGRVRPDGVESDWAIPVPGIDAAEGLRKAIDGDLAAWYAGLAPQHPAYSRLVTALARYRRIAESGGWAPVPRGDPLKSGMVDERVRVLRLRLAAEGDMPPAPAPDAPAAAREPGPIQRVADTTPADAAPPPSPDAAATFDAAVEAGVRRFQKRNGIAVDGAVGPRTLAALNVPVRARVQQIELNLERWRSLPHELGTSFMMVNVPAETLDVVDDNVPVISMKVVVGDTGHPTPVVRARMLAVTFNPTWNIPASIVTHEVVPKSKLDRSYLLKNDIVFTPGHGWQQMPGPKNPLGQIKFETPNKFDVYLHDTPSRVAFDRFFRAQSHGCVRLERAAELAGFVLRGAGWDNQQVSEAAASGASRHVDLKRRWLVYLVYATSFVDDDGTVEFRDDLYGRDARLREALAADPPERRSY